MSTTVSVTAEHIAAGERNSCWGCPIAVALWEAFPDATEIGVGVNTFDIETPDRKVTATVPLPHEAYEFICLFDGGLPVEPFTFTVDYEGTEAA